MFKILLRNTRSSSLWMPLNAQKMNFFIKDFFSKCDQIRSFVLRFRRSISFFLPSQFFCNADLEISTQPRCVGLHVQTSIVACCCHFLHSILYRFGFIGQFSQTFNSSLFALFLQTNVYILKMILRSINLRRSSRKLSGEITSKLAERFIDSDTRLSLLVCGLNNMAQYPDQA